MIHLSLLVRFLDFPSDIKINDLQLTEAYVKTSKRFEVMVKEECKHVCVSTFLDSLLYHHAFHNYWYHLL